MSVNPLKWIWFRLPYYWEVKNSIKDRIRQISDAIRWSSLATIGDSPLLKLTIIIPFLGYVIIYNDYIMHFLLLSKEHITQAGYSPEEINPVTSSRLNYIYFGLTLLGASSAIFAIFAPKEIVKHRSPVEYVQYMEPISTNNVVRTSFTTVLEFFRSVNSDEDIYKKSDIYFPNSISIRIHNLVEEIYADIEAEEAQKEAISNSDGIENDPEPEFDSELYTISGNIRTDVLVKRALSGARIFRYFEMTIFNGAKPFSKDVFYLEHIVKDYSGFWLRLIISLLYAAGFGLLFVPTATTSYKLFMRWVGG